MRRVVITGANRGVGLGLVQQLGSVADEVFATCRDPAAAEELTTLASPGKQCPCAALRCGGCRILG
jgi:NAD(P)-dependent dehydrogenase (short-subunit alcohol dehydrogenase family)